MPQIPPKPATAVLDLARSRRPTLGPGRLVCVDGPAGSGKTTLAGLVGRHVLHTDDLLDGWDGLPGLPGTLESLLAPLVGGRSGSAPRYDWHAGRFRGAVEQPPVDLLVVEGVGAGSLPAARWATVLVWVEAPVELRRRRGVDRDGAAFAAHWERWAAAEATHFAAHGTRDRADVVVDGTGGRPERVRS